ncbi:MAG: hypothetical protein LUD50_07600 [Clostridia bacterium]|nr:hypothetical protein [Clostridia bacterium]
MTLEELFTKDEMDEAMQYILSDDEYRQKYEEAPSDALRRYYLLEECFVVHGDNESVEGLLGNVAAMICQFQDEFTLEDWEYEYCNATNSVYKWKCTEKVRWILHDDNWGE